MEDRMITLKNQFIQFTWPAITFGIIRGGLAMIWPGLIAFLGSSYYSNFELRTEDCSAMK